MHAEATTLSASQSDAYGYACDVQTLLQHTTVLLLITFSALVPSADLLQGLHDVGLLCLCLEAPLRLAEVRKLF